MDRAHGGREVQEAAAAASFCLSGPAAARERAKPILALLGQQVQDFGDEVGAANVVKLCGNYLLFAATQAIAESLTVAEANGVSRQGAMDFFASTVFACPAYVNYGKRVAARDDAPGGFKLSLAAKDLRLFRGLDGPPGLPLSDLLQQRFVTALEAGQADLDVTAISRQVGGREQ